MSAATIKFDNLLTEARYAFHAGDFARAEELLREALALAAEERQAGS